MSAEGPSAPLVTPWRLVALAALPAFFHALWFLGRLHPDEWFQTFEIALHKTYGYGVVAWEWNRPPNPGPDAPPWGIRNWSVPLVISGLFRLGDALGVSSVMGRRALVALAQVALHGAMLGAVWRFSARRVGERLAHACLGLVALYGLLVWFGVRTTSESLSVAFLVWGLERLDDEQAGPRGWALGGALLGLAQVARYGSAAVIAPAMLWLLVTRRLRPFGFATASGLGVGLLLGLLDFLTWGEWFHSFVHYVRFNVLSGEAAQRFGANPWWTYFTRLHVAPWAAVGLFAWWKRPRPRAWLFVAAAGGYFAAISATAHKEDRFVYPALVLLTVAGAPAFAQWAQAQWSHGALRRALAAAPAVASLAFFVFPSPFDVQRREQFQFQARAARGATGLVLMNEGMWGSGGYFFAGSNIPWCPCDFPHDACFQVAARDPRFNRGLYWSNGNEAERPRDERSEAAFVAAGFRVVARHGQATYFER